MITIKIIMKMCKWTFFLWISKDHESCFKETSLVVSYIPLFLCDVRSVALQLNYFTLTCKLCTCFILSTNLKHVSSFSALCHTITFNTMYFYGIYPYIHIVLLTQVCKVFICIVTLYRYNVSFVYHCVIHFISLLFPVRVLYCLLTHLHWITIQNIRVFLHIFF